MASTKPNTGTAEKNFDQLGAPELGRAIREQESSRLSQSIKGKVIIDHSILNGFGDRVIKDLLTQIENHREQIAQWPDSFKLIVSMTGDSGGYCESDTRSLVTTLTYMDHEGKERKVRDSIGDKPASILERFQLITRLAELL